MKPKFNQEYYFITPEGTSCKCPWHGDELDLDRYKRKNVFNTEQECNDKINELTLGNKK